MTSCTRRLNLNESDARMGKLDVIFESEALSEVFEIHYEAVFKAAIPLVENGRKNLDNMKRVLG